MEKDKLNAKNILTIGDGIHRADRGLFLRVRGNSRIWIFRFYRFNQRYEISLGSASSVSLSVAKARATKLRGMVADGANPLDLKRSAPLDGDEVEKAPITFTEYYPTAIETLKKVKAWKNEKHAAQWVSTIRTYAEPVLGKLPLREITKGDVINVLRPIWYDKTDTATKVRGRLSLIFSQAIAEGLMAENPATWKDGLSFFLPQASKVRQGGHFEALTLKQLQAFVSSIRESKSISIKAILFGILTATRAQEFLGAKWEEIDLKKKIWTIPSERMKKGLEHRVPLSRQAVEILKSLDNKTVYVFPSPRSDKPMSIDTPRLTIQKITKTKATMHGMRSTFRDWCEENLIHEALAERSLAHVKADKVVRAYQRSDLLEQRRPVMQAWADEIFTP